jgi:exosortase/archaeosortase family protein
VGPERRELIGRGKLGKRAKGWAGWLQSKRRAVRFVIGFALILGVFYAAYLPLSQTATYDSFLCWVAEVCGAALRVLGQDAREVCGAALRVLGQDARVSGKTISSPAFAVAIIPACVGMEMTALFVAGVVAAPVSWRSRMTFALLGVLALFAVNLARIVSLFCLGVYFPAAFEVVHVDFWPDVLIVVVLFYWLLWAWRSEQTQRAKADVRA